MSEHDQIIDFLYAEISQRCSVPKESLSLDTQLTDLGMQSIEAVLLCGEIEDQFQIEIDPAEIFEHDTVGAFSETLAARSAA